MDDFDVILGMGFMMGQKSIFVLAVVSLLIMWDNPKVVQGKMRQLGEQRLLSALQFKKDLKKGDHTFVAIPIPQEEKGSNKEEIPFQIV